MNVCANTMDALEETYKEASSPPLVTKLARCLGPHASTAMYLYYRNTLAVQIDRGDFGIQDPSPYYLVDDLFENEGVART